VARSDKIQYSTAIRLGFYSKQLHTHISQVTGRLKLKIKIKIKIGNFKVILFIYGTNY